MQIKLTRRQQRGVRGLGDDTVYPVGYDSMGNPIYPSGITAQQLVNAPTVAPVSSEMVVTPTTMYEVPVGPQPSTQYMNPVVSPATTSSGISPWLIVGVVVLGAMALAK